MNQHNQLNGTTIKPENKGNFNFDSNWNLPIGAWNMIFKNISNTSIKFFFFKLKISNGKDSRSWIESRTPTGETALQPLNHSKGRWNLEIPRKINNVTPLSGRWDNVISMSIFLLLNK